jgi:hypothetical protein
MAERKVEGNENKPLTFGVVICFKLVDLPWSCLDITR